VSALRTVGIGNAAVASPFSRDVDAALKAFLEENGIRVAHLESLNQRDVHEYGKYSPATLYALGKTANRPDADGLLIPCNQLRALDVAGDLETDLGKPVVTSVQASLWLALKTLGLKPNVEGCGRLLANG
jgi:maleate cis-trans isomerase